MGKNGGKWGISQSVYPIPHKINSPFFPIGSPPVTGRLSAMYPLTPFVLPIRTIMFG